MSYEVILTDSFLKDLKKLKNKALEEQVLNKLRELEEYPERNKRRTRMLGANSCRKVH